MKYTVRRGGCSMWPGPTQQSLADRSQSWYVSRRVSRCQPQPTATATCQRPTKRDAQLHTCSLLSAHCAFYHILSHNKVHRKKNKDLLTILAMTLMSDRKVSSSVVCIRNVFQILQLMKKIKKNCRWTISVTSLYLHFTTRFTTATNIEDTGTPYIRCLFATQAEHEYKIQIQIEIHRKNRN